jgi:hypothetical protein
VEFFPYASILGWFAISGAVPRLSCWCQLFDAVLIYMSPP